MQLKHDDPDCLYCYLLYHSGFCLSLRASLYTQLYKYTQFISLSPILAMCYFTSCCLLLSCQASSSARRVTASLWPLGRQ
jgi:hypothetical protein